MVSADPRGYPSSQATCERATTDTDDDAEANAVEEDINVGHVFIVHGQCSQHVRLSIGEKLRPCHVNQTEPPLKK